MWWPISCATRCSTRARSRWSAALSCRRSGRRGHARRHHLRLAAGRGLSRSSAGPHHPRGRGAGAGLQSGRSGRLRRSVLPPRPDGAVGRRCRGSRRAGAHGRGMFGDMIPSSGHRAATARFRGGETRHVKDLEQAHFALAFESPRIRQPDIYTAQIYALALGGSMSSRLFPGDPRAARACATRSSRRPGPMPIPA